VPFNAVSVIQDRLKGLLKAASWDALVETAPYWTEIVGDSLDEAYQEILTRLAARGFTPAQIASWDRRAAFERDIALWWCLVKGAGLHDFEDKFISKLDRRAELDTVTLTIDGEVEDPESEDAAVGFGTLDDTNSTFYRSVDDERDVETHRW
jgi:hypothetical protein